MRQRQSTIGVFLLVLAIMVVGLGACSRSAERREAPDATPGETEVDSGVPSAESPAPGETVVSAVTPLPGTPGTGMQATPGPEVQPTPTLGALEPAPTAPQPTQAPSQPKPSTGQGGTIRHTVQRGETLSSIARRYGTTWRAIARANGLANPNQIYVGQKLKIPTSGGASGPSGGTSGCRIKHRVQQGEWVWQIARNYGVSPYDILAANGLTIQKANTIYAGTVLCIP